MAASSSDREGLYKVAQTDDNIDNTTIDIIAIHGLGTKSPRTWEFKQRDNGCVFNWLSHEDMLPAAIPKARIFTYDWNANYFENAPVQTLLGHASNLLAHVMGERGSTTRPIIFIASCFGGLVLAEAIIRAAQEGSPYRRVLLDAVGIVFLATPFRGSDGAKQARWQVVVGGIMGRETSTQLVEDLNSKDKELRKLTHTFAELINRDTIRLPVYCFYETKTTEMLKHLLSPGLASRASAMLRKKTKKILVTEQSACLDGVEKQPLNATHSGTNKFNGPDDANYKLVRDVLKGFVDNAFNVISRRENSASGRSDNLEQPLERASPSTNKDNRQHTTVEGLGGTLTDTNCATLPVNECLQSLSFPEMNYRLDDITGIGPRPIEGTREWLVLHKKYEAWVQGDQCVLWMKGKPGSGKSTLLQYALSEATTKPRNGALILSFFFYGRGIELQKTPLGFFRSLLHQLLSTWLNGNGALANYKFFFESSLRAILRNRSVWLFVDALDECGEDNAVELIKSFRSMLHETPSSNPQFKVCFTCRHYPILNVHYGLEICLEDENEKAIFTHVQNQLSEYTSSTISLTAPEKITKRASGIFLWARLVTERIISRYRHGMISPENIDAEIDGIPKGLDDLYQDLIRTITDTAASLKLIRWICFATRPLSLLELQWAMVIDCKPLDQPLREYERAIVDDDLMKRRVHTLSGGFAETKYLYGENRPPIVQLIHQSVLDFFVEKGLSTLEKGSGPASSVIGKAHHQLSRSCIRYLSMKELGQTSQSVDFQDVWEFGPSDSERNELMSQFPLLVYTTRSWATHERESEKHNFPQNDILEYFGWLSEDFIRLWVWASRALSIETFDPASGKGRWNPWPPKGTRMVHVMSYFQLTRPLRKILEETGSNVNLRDDLNRTPLIIAAGMGHQAVVKLLLEQPSVEVNVILDCADRTPLYAAARGGHEAVVELLLDVGKAEADLARPGEHTPLSVAAEYGHEAIVRRLLNTGKVDVNSRPFIDSTPLFFAAKNGHKAVVKCLLDTGKAVPDKKCFGGITPLYGAACNGHHAVVQLLLATGRVDADSKDMKGETPLLSAARRGHQTVVQLLLGTGKVDANHKNWCGDTPLTVATGRGCQSIVELLQKHISEGDLKT
ncbi:hypothetical protein NUW58_g7604 [Xylaria curta]|uniref:Uncharacterized protein n=1 Tax=Xylaria curta TaxID=42375 RepID=A0ACC1NIC3_9PEZI|nr:hypothetical protein NUW58_g7604 [Xylaria curta]